MFGERRAEGVFVLHVPRLIHDLGKGGENVLDRLGSRVGAGTEPAAQLPFRGQALVREERSRLAHASMLG